MGRAPRRTTDGASFAVTPRTGKSEQRQLTCFDRAGLCAQKREQCCNRGVAKGKWGHQRKTERKWGSSRPQRDAERKERDPKEDKSYEEVKRSTIQS